MPEKIVTAYQAVLDEHFSEDTALNKCKAAAYFVENMEKDVNDACAQGISNSLESLSKSFDFVNLVKTWMLALCTVYDTFTLIILRFFIELCSSYA